MDYTTIVAAAASESAELLAPYTGSAIASALDVQASMC